MCYLVKIINLSSSKRYLKIVVVIYIDMNKIWIYWDTIQDNIYNTINSLMDKSTTENIKLVKMSINNENDYINAIKILNNDVCEYTSMHSICNFLQFNSPNEELRKKCGQSDMLLKNYITALNINENIYNKINIIYNYGKKHNCMSNIENNFLCKLMDGYKNNGITNDEKTRFQLIKIRNEINKIEKNMSKNMEKSDHLLFAFNKIDLDGISGTILKTIVIKQDTTKYYINLNKHAYIICMSYIKNENVRKNIELIYHTKCADISIDILRLFVLKDEYAKLLSYDNYAEYQAHNQMSKTQSNIKKFLYEISDKITNKYLRELDTIKKIKKAKYNNIDISSHDLQFCIATWKKKYKVSDKSIREYFPLFYVIEKIFMVYGKMFDVIIEQTDPQYKWTENIYFYVVKNKTKILGYFYVDLFKRDGKRNQIRCFTLQHKSSISLPISVLVSSFKNMNTLLSHNDVILIFHEFCHIINHMLNESEYCLLDSNNMEDDFSEIPALIMENLCWNKNILKLLSCHYVTKKEISDETVDKLIKMKDINTGIYYKKHIMLSIYDQMIHSNTIFLNDAKNILKNIYPKNNSDGNKAAICLLSNLYERIHKTVFYEENDIKFNKGSIMPSSWFNFIGNTDGRYYAYLWSKVIASDIYNEKFSKIDIIDDNNNELLSFKHYILENKQAFNGQQILSCYLSNTKKNEDIHIISDVEQSYYMSTDKFNNIESNIDSDVEYSNRFSEVYSEDYPTETDSNADVIDHVTRKLESLNKK
jgi:thimet oligopeptidase